MAKKKKNKIDSTEIRFSISKIELVRKELNPPEIAVPITTNRYSYTLKADTNIFPERKTLQIIINYTFKLDQKSILELEVKNDFTFDDLRHIMNEGKVHDGELLEFLIDISTTHARGIQAIIVAGTSIDTYYLPPINHEKKPLLAASNVIKKPLKS